VDTGRELRKLPVPQANGIVQARSAGGRTELVFSPDGRYVERLVRGEGVNQPNPLAAIQPNDSAALTQATLQAVWGAGKNMVTQVVAWELTTGNTVLSWRGDDAEQPDASGSGSAGTSAFTREGAILAVATASGLVRVFDVKTSREVCSL